MAELRTSREPARRGSVAARAVRRAASGRTGREVLAFLAVGLLNTAFGYGVFAVIYLITASHRIAIVVATAIGVCFNYFTTGRLVFSGSGVRVFLRFVGAYALICTVNIVLVDTAAVWGTGALSAQAIALGLVVPLSFAVNKWLVFGART